MLRKITFIYHQHFKFVVALNLFISIYFITIFWYKGYTHYPLYMIALVYKSVAHAISIGIEKLFFQARSYHFRNLGFSYRMLFGWLYAMDLLLFIVLLFASGICKAFI